MPYVIRTTMEPWEEVTVSDQEYAALVALGVVVGVGAPAPPDPDDVEVAALVQDETSATYEAMTAAYGTPVPARALARNTVILFGTSLESQNGTGPDTVVAAGSGAAGQFAAQSSRGWLNWADGFLGHRLRLVRNAGVGGNTYAQMLARIDADVLAYQSAWVFMGGPVNDIANDRAAAAIQADAAAMLDAFQASGRRVVILTAAPSTFYDTAAKRAVLADVNRWIRDLPHTRPGVVVVDAWRVTADLTTGSPATGMAVDGVHFSEMGAQRVGREAAAVLDSVIPRRPHRVPGLLDPDQILGNPGFGAGTGWTTVDTGIAAAYTADPDRWGASIATLTLSGIASTAWRGVQYVEPITNGRYAVGDTIQLSARFRWADIVPLGTASACRPYLRLYARKSDSSFGDEVWTISTASGDNRTPVGFPGSGEMVLKTNRTVIPADTANLYVGAGWVGAASGSVQVSDVAAVKIT